MASIHDSSCAVCVAGNVVRCSLLALELSRGVAMADPTSRSRDCVCCSCGGGSQECHVVALQPCLCIQSGVWAVLPGNAEHRVELVDVAQCGKHIVVLSAALAVVQA